MKAAARRADGAWLPDGDRESTQHRGCFPAWLRPPEPPVSELKPLVLAAQRTEQAQSLSCTAARFRARSCAGGGQAAPELCSISVPFSVPCWGRPAPSSTLTLKSMQGRRSLPGTATASLPRGLPTLGAASRRRALCHGPGALPSPSLAAWEPLLGPEHAEFHFSNGAPGAPPSSASCCQIFWQTASLL